ncbi:AKIP1 protein, partial [Menura novaehollandiae]|nr:AKIP1 protein [Menura novaehollandiae]
ACHIILSVSVVVQKYYGGTAVLRCKEHEVRHFCKYHGRQEAEREMEFTEEEVSRAFFFLSLSKPRRASKDFYIDVSPGTYSVTAVSEGMVKQTHVVDVRAGQSIDLTFAL